jgi:hypothetical protein
MGNISGLPLLISGVCALALIGLVAGLIVSSKFRNDVLGGEGEASVLGLISVKGVAIVLLCALFVGGMIYPMSATPSIQPATTADIAKERDELKSVLEERNSAYGELNREYQELQLENQKAEDKKQELEKRVGELQTKIAALNKTIAGKDGEIAKLKEDGVNSDKFLRDIQLLEGQRERFQGSIDTSHYDMDKKVPAFTITQRLLKRIGFYEGPIDGDAEKTRLAVIDYKKRTFKDERYWAVITRATIIRMIGDYSERLLEELDG